MLLDPANSGITSTRLERERKRVQLRIQAQVRWATERRPMSWLSEHDRGRLDQAKRWAV